MSKLLDFIFVRNKHVCPWWFCFTFDNIFRRLLQDPYKILSGYAHDGNVAIDVGSGQGYFTIPLARMVGSQGMVYAMDVQGKMLSILSKKAEQRGVAGQIITKLVEQNSLDLKIQIDFALAFWMIHEVPNRKKLFSEIFECLKPGKYLLIAEPLIHVTGKMFEETLIDAQQIGFQVINRPKIFFSRSALLSRKAE